MKRIPTSCVLALGTALLLFSSVPMQATADDIPVFTLTLKDHRFDPAEFEIPKARKVKLIVKNLDATPEEFESLDLHREKVVAGGKEIIMSIGPLGPGRYEFFGEFNPKTARGVIIVKP